MRALGPAAVLLLLAVAAHAQTAGASPGALFDEGAGARALGMGGAMTAVAGDAGALSFNPAGLGLMSGRQAQAMHAALYGGASFDHLGYAQNFPKISGGWGAEILRFGVGGVEARDAAGNPGGTLGFSELGFGAGFGRADAFVENLALGSAVKALDRSLAGHNSRLFGLDLGAQYGLFGGERATVGLTLTNAAALSSGDTSDRLAPIARAGAAVRVAEPALVAADLSSAGRFRVGAEYRYGLFALRAGWTSDGPTLGGGLLFQEAFSCDVAVLDSSALGVSERLSLGYRFGAYRKGHHSSLALEKLLRAREALGRREYVEAGGLFDAALAEDPSVGQRLRLDGGGWKEKITRYHAFLAALGLAPMLQDQEDLRSPTIAAQLAQSAVGKLVALERGDAMILAAVSAGEGGRGSVFKLLPGAMAKATGLPVDKSLIMPVTEFLADRLQRGNYALYAHRHAEAVEYCRQGTLVDSENAAAWQCLGAARLAGGDATQARAAYEKALALDPTNAKLRELLKNQLDR